VRVVSCGTSITAGNVPSCDEGEADETAKRQHRHDVDPVCQHDLRQHVGDAKRRARNDTRGEAVHATAKRG